MTPEEKEIQDRAVAFAKAHKKAIARELTDPKIYAPDELPVSVFMAGSPGAGKTESSRNLIESLTRDNMCVVRIDSDDLRNRFAEYTGANSHLFMGATSIIAEKMQDEVLSNKQNFVFDGTLTKIDIARRNIQRSLNKGRFVQILCVYQEPIQAWKFAQAREQKDGRHIPKEAFIQQYFLARKNVNLLKEEFGKKIQVDLVIKNIDGSDFDYRENIDVVDNYIREKYTEFALNRLISE